MVLDQDDLLSTAHSEKGEQTKRELLTAAQKLFAERGFRGTSIRDIATESGSNTAAVNYHFGSKENLYREVFRRHRWDLHNRGITAVREVLERTGGRPSLRSILEAFALASKKGRDPSDFRRCVMLMHRELVEPQLDPGFGLKEVIEPLQQSLAQAISAVCPTLSDKAVHMCVHSFLAQLAHLNRLQVYFEALGPEKLPLLDSTEAIRHIVEFTTAGIEALQKKRS
jgi:AcrR family transcriptional regulator